MTSAIDGAPGREAIEPGIIGYADRMSVRPGQTINFSFSTRARQVHTDIVRLGHDLSQFEKVATTVARTVPGVRHPINAGSYATFMDPAREELPADLSATLSIFSTLESFGSERGILTWTRESGLFVSADGQLVARHGAAQIQSTVVLHRYRWYQLKFWIVNAAHEFGAAIYADGECLFEGTARIASSTAIKSLDFRLSGWREGPNTLGCYDGKISDPHISSGKDTVAKWSFAGPQDSDVVKDDGPGALHLKLHQHPRRAVTGPFWRGNELDFRRAPHEYNAIAFHCDDLTDAGWAPALSWSVPDDFPSDVYALRLQTDAGEDHIPFVVTGKSQSRPPVALLLPSFSYLCYANEHHWWHMPDVEQRAGGTLEQVLSVGEKWARANRLISPYDRHDDRTGCIHSSYLRPIVNFRAGYHHPYIPGPHQFSADLLIVDWLRSMGETFDILTDHDLHERGIEAVEGYRVVMTGSHPEYASERMLDALGEFVDLGGNIMYLGGNGFCSVVTTYREFPHVMELRRGHAAGVHWASQPGEAYHASTGEPGGNWRVRGRSSHCLFGVGTASVSFGGGRPYVRTPESYSRNYEWVFEGVDGELIDSQSVVLGAPAGFEYDRMDPAQGTSPAAVCLAVARFEPEMTGYTFEDARWTGIAAQNRADMVLIPGHNKGSVFSVGSIAWTGCLLNGDQGGKVGRITRNVLSRFKVATSTAVGIKK